MREAPRIGRHGTGVSAGKILALSLSFLLFLCVLRFVPLGIVHSHGDICYAKTDPADAKAKDTSSSGAPGKEAKPAPSVTVYVTSWCPACAMTIEYLKKKNVPYTVKDIEKNPAYLREMVKKAGGYRGVPVIDINGKTYLGFHPSIIDDLAK